MLNPYHTLAFELFSHFMFSFMFSAYNALLCAFKHFHVVDMYNVECIMDTLHSIEELKIVHKDISHYVVSLT